MHVNLRCKEKTFRDTALNVNQAKDKLNVVNTTISLEYMCLPSEALVFTVAIDLQIPLLVQVS